jgi:hypothetical protein
MTLARLVRTKVAVPIAQKDYGPPIIHTGPGGKAMARPA